MMSNWLIDVSDDRYTTIYDIINDVGIILPLNLDYFHAIWDNN